jgi:hypothetical protein
MAFRQGLEVYRVGVGITAVERGSNFLALALHFVP